MYIESNPDITDIIDPHYKACLGVSFNSYDKLFLCFETLLQNFKTFISHPYHGSWLQNQLIQVFRLYMKSSKMYWEGKVTMLNF